MIPVRSERIYSIQSALKCARRELKLYIFTELYDVTLVRAWRRCAAQIHEWMFRNKVNFSGFPCSGSREQWTLCREQWTPCREQWTPCREQWTPCREQWTPCREQWTQCREQWTPCREQWTPCREQWTPCREQWTPCREQWTPCREQWTPCREQWTPCREQWTPCREQWTPCREQWTPCREQWTPCREQWTPCREQWTPCREQWTPCREQWTPCREQWTPCREQWTPCREQWTPCRDQWTPCREQWTLCRERVNRNTVHARSALLTSWLSESGVLTKRDMQNMQSGGARGLELRPSVLLHATVIFFNQDRLIVYFLWQMLCPLSQVSVWLHLLRVSVSGQRQICVCARSSSWEALQRGAARSGPQGRHPGDAWTDGAQQGKETLPARPLRAQASLVRCYVAWLWIQEFMHIWTHQCLNLCATY